MSDTIRMAPCVHDACPYVMGCLPGECMNPMGSQQALDFQPDRPTRPVIDWTRAKDLAYVQKLNREVADYLFPDRSPNSMFLKMYEEVGEMVAHPRSTEETADVLIMLLDHMDQLGEMAGAAILTKLEKNLRREWDQDSATGIYKGSTPE